MRKLMFAAMLAAPLALAMSAPAVAQNYPFDYGNFADVTGIDILDGGGIEYANYLAKEWRKNQEFAKSQGWISSYEVMTNVYARKGEPDIYLITRFSRLADAAEEMKRDEAYRAHMQRTVTQMETESGDRAKFRKLAGSMLMRELRFKK